MSVRRRASGRVHYNYFRDYDPASGRYAQSDPIGLRGGLTTYGYAGGNPLRYVDLFGLCAEEEKKKEKECNDKLTQMLFIIEAVRADRGGYKGLAQRFRQMGRGSMSAKVRAGYAEAFRNEQKNLRDRMKDYIDSGCGNPPPLATEWVDKVAPTGPPPAVEYETVDYAQHPDLTTPSAMPLMIFLAAAAMFLLT